MVWVSTIAQIKKRDGRIVPFDQTKIVQAIMKAAQAVHGHDDRLALSLADSVIKAVNDGRDTIPTVEAIQDAIEKVLISQGHARTAKAFILYRATRSRIREGKSELMETVGDILQADVPRGLDLGRTRFVRFRLLIGRSGNVPLNRLNRSFKNRCRQLGMNKFRS